jgi:hypothetical protein
MTVTELIEKLSELPGNLPVVGSDYENGRYDIETVHVVDPWGNYPRSVELT